ncbi:MAG: transposase family protein [Ketobacter sp.]|nr:transposase family protein [Ketobacter sp.]
MWAVIISSLFLSTGSPREAWFAQLLDLEHGISCRDTFNDAFNPLNPHEFAYAFTQYVCSLGDLSGDVFAFDGKVMRGT